MGVHNPAPNWITPKEAAELLGKSESWLYKARQGKWRGPPAYGFNRSVRYKEHEVWDFIESCRIKPTVAPRRKKR